MGRGYAETSFFVIVVAAALIWLSYILDLPWLYNLSESWQRKDGSFKPIHLGGFSKGIVYKPVGSL